MSYKALLVIDMQKGSFTPETPRHDTPGIINRINLLADKFRTSGNHVFYIQHDGTKNNDFIPSTEAWEILLELNVSKEDVFINKYANDVFYNSNLKSKLEAHHINELFITGCATDFCVEATIQSALAKDYNITVVKDAHTTGDRPHLSAEKIIEHYNWVWQNMIPTKGTIKVEEFDTIYNSIPKLKSINFLDLPELTTERLIIRYVSLDDYKAIFNLRSNIEINRYIDRHIPTNFSEAKDFIIMISEKIKENKNLYWVITLKQTQEIIGTIGYQKFSDDFQYAEVGYELHPSFHKKGYMTETLQKVINFGFDDLKLKTIEAFTHKNNESSKALLKKNNFIFQPDRIDEGFENNSIFQLKY